MKGTMVVLLAAAALCGCSSTKEIYTPEGSIVYAISCQLQSYDSCIMKAGETCGTLGYRFVLADGSPVPASALLPAAAPAVGTEAAASADPAAPASVPAAPGTPAAGSAFNRKYYVRCHS